MEIEKNYELKKINTFGVSAKCDYFFELKNTDEIKELFTSEVFKKNEKLFIGRGSNILFTKNFSGIVVLNKIFGINIKKEDKESVWVEACGGESWSSFVDFVVEAGYWGAENLTSIPGTVGAAPVQNIGAYGVEVKDLIESVETYSIETGERVVFSNKDCEFGYRESVFKNKYKGKYFISAVVFKLSKEKNTKTEYKVLKEHIEKNNLSITSPKDVSDIVASIRKSKLPDPGVLGNAGSFFKNPVISKKEFIELKNKFPEAPSFEEVDSVKVPAGWLIEQCGWKGKKVGNVGMHEHQALVLVNYGGATGQEIKEFSDKVIVSVKEKFNIELAREVNLI